MPLVKNDPESKKSVIEFLLFLLSLILPLVVDPVHLA